MAHFAQLDDNNLVINVIVISNDVVDNLEFPESEDLGIKFCQHLCGADTIWKQTSYNSSFRMNYASIGSIYDDELDIFIPEKPFNSWILNSETYNWEPPIPYPDDENRYVWNEETLSWDKVEII